MVQLVTCDAYNLQDLGSSPRSGTRSLLFFNTRSHAGTLLRTTIVHPKITIHASKKISSRAQIEGIPWRLVNVSHVIPKVKKIQACWAQNVRLAPPNWGLKPPWFAFSYSYLYFIFFIAILFNLSS